MLPKKQFTIYYFLDYFIIYFIQIQNNVLKHTHHSKQNLLIEIFMQSKLRTLLLQYICNICILQQFYLFHQKTQNNVYYDQNSKTEVQKEQQNQHFQNNEFTSPAKFIKANIIYNLTMIFTNYLQIDYALIFEEQLKILNNHQDYLKKLQSHKLYQLIQNNLLFQSLYQNNLQRINRSLKI
ncbi:unnamed protein product [Paramecium sonneborni]|uniref:Transmembrane protein n=1 Tax=Paramecium sonneborni TaxID=65129 RepID=A0A8S1R2V6_9CILI|nr:unnamed protein product [Paramecium sonneborni]